MDSLTMAIFEAMTNSIGNRLYRVIGQGVCLGILSVLVLDEGLAAGNRGSQFIGFDAFSGFSRTRDHEARTEVWLSPWIHPQILWDQLVVSWNTKPAASAGITIEARAEVSGVRTRFYQLGIWSFNRGHRKSVNGQSDRFGKVLTDTLVLHAPAGLVQVRLTRRGPWAGAGEWLKFLGLSLVASSQKVSPLPPNRKAWGRELKVPRFCQLHYKGGEVWCSPASTAMVLSHWGSVRGREDLKLPVPVVADGVYDPAWPGTGNWAFNTAFAGGLPGTRAYVTRLSDLSELEDWIAFDCPVAVSVSYNLLKGKDRPAPQDGHLVVCIGFTARGDIIVNDPAKDPEVRCVYPRDAFKRAWRRSHFTVYLIYPVDQPIPEDRFGHWF